MSNKDKTKYISLFSFHVPVLIFAAAVIGIGTIAAISTSKPEDSTVLGSKNQSSKGSKSGGSETKNPNTAKIKEPQAITEAKTVKGAEHRKVLTDVVSNLEDAADTEEVSGNTETSEDVTEVADATEDAASTTVEAVDELETESPFKVFLVGYDYKNLGQLRSSLAHTENSIRKLDKALTSATPESTEAITASRTALDLEKTRIYNIVSDYETKFSLLGWMTKLLNGYTPLPSPTPTPSGSATPTATPSASPEATNTPSPTPESTSTPEPTSTPTPAA